MKKELVIHSTIINFNKLIEYQDNSIVSKTLVDKEAGSISLFAFDKGQKLSPHKASYDALVQVVDGEVEIIIDKDSFQLKSFESIIMPANIEHAVNANQKFKMLLTMIKSEE